jgi:hypothetical protein
MPKAPAKNEPLFNKPASGQQLFLTIEEHIMGFSERIIYLLLQKIKLLYF